MKKTFFLLFMFVLQYTFSQKINYNFKDLTLEVVINKSSFQYSTLYKNKIVLYPSFLDIKLKDNGYLLNKGFEVLKIDTIISNNFWEPILGEQKIINDNNKKIVFYLKTLDNILININFKIFKDAISFNYEFPKQNILNHFVVLEEKSQFNLQKNYTAWWMAGSYNTNEYEYNETKLQDINAYNLCGVNNLFLPLGCDSNLIQTPLMLKSPDGLYLNIHEAALIHYPAMQIKLNKQTNTFTSDLVPDAFGNKAYLQTPFKTPWRVVLISDKATDIIASKTILNLNDTTKYKDVSWIKPVKYIGVWWEMFVGKGTWDYLGTQNSSQDSKPTGRHSANTNNVKKYLDFAAKHKFDGVLVEGWNVGWEDWFGKWKEDVFDFVTPYPDFNVKELQEYAKSKGVYLIMHHETSGSVTNYERHFDSAFKFMNNFGYPAVKTGYVGPIIPRGENHDGQWMIDHYVRVAKKAADYKIMIDVHEPVRPTGLQRTFPNWLASEAARGMEYNAWGNGNKIDHDLNLIFNRLIGGPMDYTPGIFKLKLDYFPNKKEIIHSTLARQLALYVCLYSPHQMAADIPENYEAKLDAFQFIKDVPVNWDDTKILEAEPGDYITTVRKEKNSNNWFLGSMTDEKPRKTKIKLDFLDANKTYNATIYKDNEKTLLDINPEAYTIEKRLVKKGDEINLEMVGGGGEAISFIEKK